MAKLWPIPNHRAGEGSIDAGRKRQQREEVARDIMKTQLFLVCAALALGSGCATYDSGGTADDTVVVSGSGYRDYYSYDSYPYDNTDLSLGYDGDPIKDMGRGPAVWKQPSPNGQDWVDARPDLLWYPRR